MLKKRSTRASLLCAVVMLFAVCANIIDDSMLGYGNSLFLSLIILQFLIMAVPALFYIKAGGPGYTDKLHLNLIKPASVWFTVTAAVSLIFGTSVIRLTMSYMGATDSLFGEYSAIISSTIGDPGEIVYVLIAFAIIPAICEELIYRGIVMTEYSEYGYATMAIIPAIYCAMFRFNVGTLLLFIFSGAVYSLAVVITDSLLSSVIIHIIFNAFNIFFEKYILRIITQNEYAVLCTFILVTLALISFVLMFAEIERLCYNSAIEKEKANADKADKKEEDEAVSKDDSINGSLSERFHNWSSSMLVKLKKFGSAFISPFFAACVVLYIIGCISNLK